MFPKSSSKSSLRPHVKHEVSQIGLALKDCARQLRYAARNLPASEPLVPWSPRTPGHASLPHFSLGSVGRFADNLLETAESFAGHAVPPLQDHWKSPVRLESVTAYMSGKDDHPKNPNNFSMTYYAAAKRFIMLRGATDVLIFEHRIGTAFDDVRVPPALPNDGLPEWQVGAPGTADDVRDACVRLALSLIDLQTIQSVRFKVLPDTTAPWWLVSDPNAYVFLALSLAVAAQVACPAAMPQESDAAMRFVADIVGAREGVLKRALMGPDRAAALNHEFENILGHL